MTAAKGMQIPQKCSMFLKGAAYFSLRTPSHPFLTQIEQITHADTKKTPRLMRNRPRAPADFGTSFSAKQPYNQWRVCGSNRGKHAASVSFRQSACCAQHLLSLCKLTKSSQKDKIQAPPPQASTARIPRRISSKRRAGNT